MLVVLLLMVWMIYHTHVNLFDKSFFLHSHHSCLCFSILAPPMQVTGATGAYCAPQCTGLLPPPIGGKCTTDYPKGCSSCEGQCLISDQDTGEHLCALVCDADTDCPKRASCKDLGGAKICTVGVVRTRVVMQGVKIYTGAALSRS